MVINHGVRKHKLHCTYKACQMLTAIDDEKVMPFHKGVKCLPAKNIDVFFITLNKSDKDYTSTAMYSECFLQA